MIDCPNPSPQLFIGASLMQANRSTAHKMQGPFYIRFLLPCQFILTRRWPSCTTKFTFGILANATSFLKCSDQKLFHHILRKYPHLCIRPRTKSNRHETAPLVSFRICARSWSACLGTMYWPMGVKAPNSSIYRRTKVSLTLSMRS